MCQVGVFVFQSARFLSGSPSLGVTSSPEEDGASDLGGAVSPAAIVLVRAASPSLAAASISPSPSREDAAKRSSRPVLIRMTEVDLW